MGELVEAKDRFADGEAKIALLKRKIEIIKEVKSGIE